MRSLAVRVAPASAYLARNLMPDKMQQRSAPAVPGNCGKLKPAEWIWRSVTSPVSKAARFDDPARSDIVQHLQRVSRAAP